MKARLVAEQRQRAQQSVALRRKELDDLLQQQMKAYKEGRLQTMQLSASKARAASPAARASAAAATVSAATLGSAASGGAATPTSDVRLPHCGSQW